MFHLGNKSFLDIYCSQFHLGTAPLRMYRFLVRTQFLQYSQHIHCCMTSHSMCHSSNRCNSANLYSQMKNPILLDWLNNNMYVFVSMPLYHWR